MSRPPKNKVAPQSAALWLLDSGGVREDDLEFFGQQLGVGEAHRYARFTRVERKRQFLLGHMLLRAAVSDLTGLSPEDVGVVERPGNAPQLVLSDSQCLPQFSLSHSRNWIVCAVSRDANLGVDIEVRDSTRDVVALSETAFDPGEHLWLLRQPDGTRVSAFYDLWSTREALHKLLSRSGREATLSSLIGADGSLASQGCGWHRYASSHPGLTLVVCSDRPLSALRKIELTGLTRAEWLRTFIPISLLAGGIASTCMP